MKKLKLKNKTIVVLNVLKPVKENQGTVLTTATIL